MIPALLPAGGDLDIEVLDVTGNVIAGAGDFGNHDDTADARVRIPVVAGQTYYLHVYGATDDVVNGYDMTVTNVAPPVPYDIELARPAGRSGLRSDAGSAGRSTAIPAARTSTT